MGDPCAVGAKIRMRLPSPTPIAAEDAVGGLAGKDITAAVRLIDVATWSDLTGAVGVKVAQKPGFRAFRQSLVHYAGFHTAGSCVERSAQHPSGQMAPQAIRTAIARCANQTWKLRLR
jgi:hypothetical protein